MTNILIDSYKNIRYQINVLETRIFILRLKRLLRKHGFTKADIQAVVEYALKISQSEHT